MGFFIQWLNFNNTDNLGQKKGCIALLAPKSGGSVDLFILFIFC